MDSSRFVYHVALSAQEYPLPIPDDSLLLTEGFLLRSQVTGRPQPCRVPHVMQSRSLGAHGILWCGCLTAPPLTMVCKTPPTAKDSELRGISGFIWGSPTSLEAPVCRVRVLSCLYEDSHIKRRCGSLPLISWLSEVFCKGL